MPYNERKMVDKETKGVRKRKKGEKKNTKTHTIHRRVYLFEVFVRGIYRTVDQYREVCYNNLLTFSRRTKRFPFLPFPSPGSFLFASPAFCISAILQIVTTTVLLFFSLLYVNSDSFTSSQVEREIVRMNFLLVKLLSINFLCVIFDGYPRPRKGTFDKTKKKRDGQFLSFLSIGKLATNRYRCNIIVIENNIVTRRLELLVAPFRRHCFVVSLHFRNDKVS